MEQAASHRLIAALQSFFLACRSLPSLPGTGRLDASASERPGGGAYEQKWIEVRTTMATTRMTYAAAMADAFRLCFRDDPHFTVIGNEVFGIGPQRVQFEPLQHEFPDRIYFPPTSEAAFTALAAGAAMCGHRTFAHLGVASFTYSEVSWFDNAVAT